MRQFFDDEDDGKDIETETKPVSAAENSDCNSLPSIGDADAPTGFIANREEIFQIVKYWRTQVLDVYWVCFMSGAGGLDILEEKKRANSRFKLAEVAIGKEAVLAAIKEANDDFVRVGDEWHNEIFWNGTREQWSEVQEETWRGEYEQYCEADLKQMEELETKYPGDLIALVLYDSRAGKRSTVLGFSIGDAELIPVLEASPQFEVLTTKSRIRCVTANRELRYRGFIRARRQGRDWLFDFPGSTPGTVVSRFLESVRNQIEKVLSDVAGRESNRA